MNLQESVIRIKKFFQSHKGQKFANSSTGKTPHKAALHLPSSFSSLQLQPGHLQGLCSEGGSLTCLHRLAAASCLGSQLGLCLCVYQHPRTPSSTPCSAHSGLSHQASQNQIASHCECHSLPLPSSLTFAFRSREVGLLSGEVSQQEGY
jgi:hypothetical protein